MSHSKRAGRNRKRFLESPEPCTAIPIEADLSPDQLLQTNRVRDPDVRTRVQELNLLEVNTRRAQKGQSVSVDRDGERTCAGPARVSARHIREAAYSK